MGNGATAAVAVAKWRLARCAFDVDVNPLRVADHAREVINRLLGDGDPGAQRDLAADQGRQFGALYRADFRRSRATVVGATGGTVFQSISVRCHDLRLAASSKVISTVISTTGAS